ncbi:hypothetical protein PACTADRAFT_51520 [Pachysolen tannophilus NRRL Y-2460]|uniref:C2H2-type domain-containing protein n=1 Tax=Pachysolen tannophilus NRRL Y-2460 TaxID=669874 RepID=A0A1E4TPT1_PACTA|nr:hypothetical protein PACTADRAFT_51520 [Pachysolen tannophilus NRRL Y-2460]
MSEIKTGSLLEDKDKRPSISNLVGPTIRSGDEQDLKVAPTTAKEIQTTPVMTTTTNSTPLNSANSSSNNSSGGGGGGAISANQKPLGSSSSSSTQHHTFQPHQQQPLPAVQPPQYFNPSANYSPEYYQYYQQYPVPQYFQGMMTQASANSPYGRYYYQPYPSRYNYPPNYSPHPPSASSNQVLPSSNELSEGAEATSSRNTSTNLNNNKLSKITKSSTTSGVTDIENVSGKNNYKVKKPKKQPKVKLPPKQEIVDNSGTNIQRPYPCTHEGCLWAFARQSDLKRHIKSHMPPAFHCPFWKSDPTCHRNGGAFNRLDVLKRHLKLVHFVQDKDDFSTSSRIEKGWCRSCQRQFSSVREFVDHCETCAANLHPTEWKQHYSNGNSNGNGNSLTSIGSDISARRKPRISKAKLKSNQQESPESIDDVEAESVGEQVS